MTTLRKSHFNSDEFSEQGGIYIEDTEEFNLAIELLDNHNISYTLDSDDQIMIEEDFVEDAIEFLDFAGIEYKEIEDTVHMATVDWEKSDYSFDLISEPEHGQKHDLGLTDADLKFAEQMQDNRLDI